MFEYPSTFIHHPVHRMYPIIPRQIRLRTETLSKIKEENGAVATEISAERRAKKKLSQHRVSPSRRQILESHDLYQHLSFSQL